MHWNAHSTRQLWLRMTPLDSKVVSREIRNLIWPQLKAAGFGRFTTRVAWRHNADSIDVLDFQSLSKYNADVLDITAHSFSVRLGKYLLYVPPVWPVKSKDGCKLPAEYECLFRGSILPRVFAAPSSGNTWSIDSKGTNLMVCLEDVAHQLTDSLAWFSRLDDRVEVLRILLEEDPSMERLWGFGRNPSPSRSYHTGYVALAMGQTDTATAKLQEAVDSECYVNVFASVGEAIKRAQFD